MFSNIFRKDKNPSSPDPTQENFPSAARSPADLGSPPLSRSPSPTKPPRKSPSKQTRERESRPASAQSLRGSWSKATAARRPSAYDRNSHPLNLPPHELKRLSAMSQMSDPSTPMEIDQEGPMSPAPSSPLATAPGAFPPPNATNGDSSPVPPPHKATPTAPSVEAETFKAAGNKYFKAREYDKAIKEYTKGSTFFLPTKFKAERDWKVEADRYNDSDQG